MPMTDDEDPPPRRPSATRPGYKTTEFWGAAVVTVLPWLTDSLPPHWRVVVSAGTQCVYAVARALTKMADARRRR